MPSSWVNLTAPVEFYFSKIAGNAADTTVNLLRTTMRRYRRNSLESWGWPPLFSNEKLFFPADIPSKKSGIFFDTDSEKGKPFTETPVQFTYGHDIPRGPINWLSLLMLNGRGEFLQRLWRFEVRRYFSKIRAVIYRRKFPKKRL